MHRCKIVAALPLALLAAACLETAETRHTLYLARDGAVAWSISELELRSTEKDKEKARREEADYLDLFAAGEHPIARALWQLGAEAVDSRLVRSRRPYTTQTEGRFASVADLATTLLHQLEIPGEARLSREGDLTRLSIELWPEEARDSDDGEGDLLALLDACDGLRVVLAEGTFLAAEGLALEDGGRAAAFPSCEKENLPEDGKLAFTLAW